MLAWVQKWLTTETVLCAIGFVWFFVSSASQGAIPMQISIPPLMPGVEAISPGLLIGVALVPVLLKIGIPGAVPFVHGVKPTEAKPDA